MTISRGTPKDEWFNPLVLIAAKSSLPNFWEIFKGKAWVG